jgi:hypothetical protein
MAAVERIEPAYGGLDTDSAPDAISKTRAPVLENFLVDRPGKLPMRGPINGTIQIYSGSPDEKPVGVWAWRNSLLIGLKANSATATRDPWVAPYRHAAAAGDLAAGHTTAYHLDLDSGAVTSLSPAANQVPGPRSTALGDVVYGIGYGSATTSTQGGSVQRHRPILKWDGTAALPTVLANAPLMAQDCRAHLNRLFVVGGMVPGTTTYAPNSLFWSDAGGPTADTLAQWQDDVSGLVNQVVIESTDPSDFGVGLAKVGRSLVVFKRRSTHLVLGSTPSTFEVRTFATDVGCIDARSIVEWKDGVFFASDQGFMWFDGQQIQNVTENLRSTVVAAMAQTAGDNGVDGGRVVASRLPNDYIFFGVGVTPATTGPSDMTFTGLYHPPRDAWVELTSDALSGGRPIDGGLAQTRTFLVDDTKVVQANALTAPETVPETERGFDSDSPIFTFDTSGAGPLFNGTGDALKNQLTAVTAWTTQVDTPIPARWWSKLARLSQSFLNSVVQRLAVDYTFAIDGGTDDGSSGWTVSLVDGRGNVLLSPTAMPSQGDPSSHAYRRQYLAEINGEAEDAQLRIEYLGPATAIKDAAIFNSHIEFEPAQKRQSF